MHLVHYRQLMGLYGYDEAMMCKAFPVSLQGIGLVWFNQLQPSSIGSFEELEEAFTTRFVTSSTQSKTIDALVGLKRQSGEKLRKYAERYWEI